VHETLFSVPVRDLERSDLRRTWEIPPAWLDRALADSDARSDGTPGALELYLKKTGREVLVKGHARAGVIMPCARTLEPVPVALDAEILLLLTPASAQPSGTRSAEPGVPGRRRRGTGGARGAGTGTSASNPTASSSSASTPGPGSPSASDPAPNGTPAGSATRTAAAGRHASARGAAVSSLPASARTGSSSGRRHSSSDDELDDAASELLSAEEAARDEYSGDSVALDVFVREHLLLELPLFPVRSDLPFEPNAATNTPPDDSGAAPDPRLAPLAALAIQLKKTGKLPKSS
jgi:uncharacterized metal-binding protein YceD (DUF177 family)